MPFKYSRKSSQPFQNDYQYLTTKPNPTDWFFPLFPDKPEADGLKRQLLEWQGEAQVENKSERKSEETQERGQLGEMMQRKPDSKVHTLALI